MENVDSWNNASETVLSEHFPLHRACRDGDVETVQKFIESILIHGKTGALFVEDSFYGWTPIHYAAYFGSLACLRKLLTLPMFVSSEIQTNKFRQTPCHLAAFGGNVHCLKWLLDSNASVHALDYIGETPAHKAARSSSVECLSLLIAQGANLSSKNNAGQTPIDVAEMCNQKPCAEYLRNILLLQQTVAVRVEETKDLRSERVVINGSYGFQPTLVVGTKVFADGPSIQDVLMDKGVSFNVTPVAGRKRARNEDLCCTSEKRLKTDECSWMSPPMMPTNEETQFLFVAGTSRPFGCSF